MSSDWSVKVHFCPVLIFASSSATGMVTWFLSYSLPEGLLEHRDNFLALGQMAVRHHDRHPWFFAGHLFGMPLERLGLAKSQFDPLLGFGDAQVVRAQREPMRPFQLGFDGDGHDVIGSC